MSLMKDIKLGGSIRLMPKPSSPAKDHLLVARHVTKSFGTFVANDDVNFTLGAGELHALLGENGAGKSTFVKMIYGLLQPDSGGFEWHGRPVDISNPQQARAMGIGMVFQHFSLFDSLTVAENIELALPETMNREELRTLIRARSADYGIPLDPDSMVADLSVGQQQRVEIVRCLLQDPSLLIMDEPTSVLTPQETDQLFDVLRRLASSGCAVLFISHKLDEIKKLTSRATILRGGRNVAEVETVNMTTHQMAELMVGETVDAVKSGTGPVEGEVLFSVTALSREAHGPFDTPLEAISFAARSGEILGIAGIAGNGQDELMSALSGEWRGQQRGVIRVGQTDVSQLGPQHRRHHKICFIPEERNGHAAVPQMRLSENALLTGFQDDGMVKAGMVQQQAILSRSELISATFDVRRPLADPYASALSGGNLQKFVVGREIIKQPRILIVAQPTWGVDVGAATFIRQAMIELAAAGSAVVVISQDLEEIFAISNRIAVLSAGRLSEPQLAAQMTAQTVGLLMGGVHSSEDTDSLRAEGG